MISLIGSTVIGSEAASNAAFAGSQNVKLEMYQYEFTVGIKYKFDEAMAPLK